VDAAHITQGHAQCPECGGAARTLPGESYSADDDGLFRELGAALQEAAITPQSASALAAQLESRHYEQPGRALRRLAQSVPALGILELIVLNQPGALRKAEGMLAVLLDALARGRRNSGFMTVVADSREPSELPKANQG
jgi:hypothetical protein